MAEENTPTTAKPEETLRSYQLDAVDAWFENSCRGILEMATGTGKTKTAQRCIETFMGSQDLPVVVVVAPTQTIAVQWRSTLASLKPVTTFDGTDWRAAIRDKESAMRLGIESQLVVIAIQNTAAMNKFHDIIRPVLELSSMSLLVADEVHALGAPVFQRALLPEFDCRLGLSATPSRWFDDRGTQVILRYFDGVAFVFGIHEALNWVDPRSGLTPLCPYEYDPVFVDLTDLELESYIGLTKRISELLSMGAEIDRYSKEKSSMDQELEELTFLRAQIVKSAENKANALDQILGKLGSVRDCIVYCTDRVQMHEAMEVLHAHGVIYKTFTGEEGTLPHAKFHGMSEREWILADFESGRTQVLVAMKCLDEGVDIPSARIGIILASTTNPREFIQRRGRLLRRSPGKERARIFDLVVVAEPPQEGDFLADKAAQAIFYREMKRVEEFALDAIDSTRANTKIVNMTLRMGLTS